MFLSKDFGDIRWQELMKRKLAHGSLEFFVLQIWRRSSAKLGGVMGVVLITMA